LKVEKWARFKALPRGTSPKEGIERWFLVGYPFLPLSPPSPKEGIERTTIAY